MTKTVVHQRKQQRAGVGGNRYEYLLNEYHFQAAARNAATGDAVCSPPKEQEE